MSRLASKPVIFEAGVAVTLGSGKVQVKGPKGELTVPVAEGIEVKVEGSNIHVNRRDDTIDRDVAEERYLRLDFF